MSCSTARPGTGRPDSRVKDGSEKMTDENGCQLSECLDVPL